MRDHPDDAPLIPMMFPCPHCEKPGITLFRKLGMGPAIAATCRACGGKVGVPWRSMLFPVLPWTVLSAVMLVVLRPNLVPIPELPGLLIPTRTAIALTVLSIAWFGLACYWIYRIPLIRR